MRISVRKKPGSSFKCPLFFQAVSATWCPNKGYFGPIPVEVKGYKNIMKLPIFQMPDSES
jgi:hypothetical protein